MDTKDAGRMGGLATRKSHGDEFYKKIGKKGGDLNARRIRKYGISQETRDKLSEAGRKGGGETKRKYGREFYQKLGRKGGSVPKSRKLDKHEN